MEKEMHKIDHLLANGQEDEAILRIKEVWEREAQEAQKAELKLIKQLNRELDELEKRSPR
jgi:hypothetical protein